MEERKYLKWYNKVGYGSGDIAGNVVYAFLTSFVMIYLTDTIGLNAGIVGTLIAVSKLFDGVSDIFFGSMIDRTKSKMGKARPWMFYGFFQGRFRSGPDVLQGADGRANVQSLYRRVGAHQL